MKIKYNNKKFKLKNSKELVDIIINKYFLIRNKKFRFHSILISILGIIIFFIIAIIFNKNALLFEISTDLISLLIIYLIIYIFIIFIIYIKSKKLKTGTIEFYNKKILDKYANKVIEIDKNDIKCMVSGKYSICIFTDKYFIYIPNSKSTLTKIKKELKNITIINY